MLLLDTDTRGLCKRHGVVPLVQLVVMASVWTCVSQTGEWLTSLMRRRLAGVTIRLEGLPRVSTVFHEEGHCRLFVMVGHQILAFASTLWQHLTLIMSRIALNCMSQSKVRRVKARGAN